MKSLEELSAIRDKMRNNAAVREGDGEQIRIVVGMATCGIAAGAREALSAIMTELEKREIRNAVVSQTGCIGMCKLEPIVDIYIPGKEKVSYVLVKPDKIPRIIAEHVVNGRPVLEYTIGAYEK